MTVRRQHLTPSMSRAMFGTATPENPASYVSETDYFEADWQQAFWGAHYARLKQIKRRYDPEGLFFVHHSVGSEDWSADGFERVTYFVVTAENCSERLIR